MNSALKMLYRHEENKWMDNERENQEAVLTHILRKNESARFGREYLFREIKSVQDYRRCVPLSMYQDVEPYIQKMLSGENNALIAEPFSAWIESVGISGDMKLFPYTESIARNFVNAFLKLFGCSAEDWKYMQGKMLCGLEHSAKTLGEKPVGDMLSLGFKTLKETPVLGEKVTPSLDTTSIVHWKDRWREIASQVKRQNITSALVDPVLFLTFLKQMAPDIEGADLHQLWPDFFFVVSAIGSAPYRNVIHSLLGDVVFGELFCINEMVVGVQRDEKGVIPLYNQNFFEFIPLDEWIEMETEGGMYREFEFNCKTSNDVVKDEEYVLVITTQGGLYRYIPGDVVRIVDNLRIERSGFVDAEPKMPGEHLVLLREVAREEMNSGSGRGHQVVALESRSMGYLFGMP